MNKRLLYLDDLVEFYSTRKKSMKFSSKETGEPIVVQVAGSLKFEETDNNLTAGLTPVRLQACHTERNLNKSSISFEVMQNKLLPTFKNRPILGFIHDVDGKPQFYGHNAHEEDGEIVYDEIAIGNIPETNNAELVYDEENDRYNVMIDGYVYDEYTKASEIIQREGECPCSVEISIISMRFDAKDRTLVIEDGYFSGVAILGYDENGNKVQPGMSGSNIKLKDFSKSNNSILNDFSYEEQSKLIETLDKLNETLSSLSNFNINKNEINTFEKGGNDKNMFEELLTKYSKTVEDITFEYENLSDDELSAKFEEVFGKCGDDDKKEKCEEDPDSKSDEDTNEPSEDSTDGEPSNEDVEPDNPNDKDDDTLKEDNACGGGSGSKKKKNNSQNETVTRTYELSHDDIRCALYNLLALYEEADDDYYWIMEVFDTYFVYQGCTGKVYGQKYSKDDENIAFDGERYELYLEYLTESEKAELETMRSNYSVISEKLAKYEEAEELADKMTVFSDEAYANYLETDEFKSLMKEETLKKFTKEELAEKADAALGKVIKTTKTFSVSDKKDEKNTPSFFAFSRIEQNTSFLDGLLKK